MIAYNKSLDMKATIKEPCDVIVVGAGPAGIGAALASARNGARTTLIETHGCLGGIWTAGQLAWIFEGDNSGIDTEIALKLGAMGARNGVQFHRYSYDIESMKVLLERLCVEAGVSIRLHTRIVDAVVDDGRIVQLVTESKSGREFWPAKIFIDCSGDGDLGAFAGCSFDMGGPNGEIQPSTLMGIVSVKDISLLKDFISFLDTEVENPWPNHLSCIDNFMREMTGLGIQTSYARPTIFHLRDNLCALMINHEYKVSAINADDISRATIRARAEIYKVVEGLRSLVGKWESLTLAATAEQIGIREGRRIHGLYSVSNEDILSGATFPDGVCGCNFGVDVHSPDPKKDKGLSNMGMKVRPYQIPYRALVAKDVKGLLMAGRCISGSWLAHASYRVTGTAVSLGEAAGRAAALCSISGRLPDEISWGDVTAAN